MKRMICVLLAILCMFSMTGCTSLFSTTEEEVSESAVEVSGTGEESEEETLSERLYDANTERITVEEKDIHMNDDVDGVAEIVVMLPDYQALFAEAAQSEDPDGYLLEALSSDDLVLREYTLEARVTVENGEKVVHTEEAVEELLEQELSKAISALTEE